MSIQFNPLPTEVFPEEARPYIARLNRELRDLFALEGVLRNPLRTKRSDETVVRRSEVQVDVSRITPSLDLIVSGSSTVVGTPALTFGQTNVVGTTTTALSINSSIAIFGTALPSNLAASAALGTSAFAATADHAHRFPSTLETASGATNTLALSNSGSNVALTSGLTSGLLDLISSRTDGAVTASRINWNIGVASPTSYGKALEIGYTNNAAAFVPVASAYPVYGGLAQALLVDEEGAGERIGFKRTSDETQFSGFRMEGGGGNITFYVRNTASFSALLGSLQVFAFGGADAVLDTGNNQTLVITPRINPASGGFLAAVYPRNTGALTAGSYVLEVSESIAAQRDTPRFRVREGGRGVVMTGGDYAVDASAKGLVNKDTQGTARYWRFFLDATGNSGSTIRVDENGLVSGTREAGGTGAVILNMKDVGTALP